MWINVKLWCCFYLSHRQSPAIWWFPHCSLPRRCKCQSLLYSLFLSPAHFGHSYDHDELQHSEKYIMRKTLLKCFFCLYMYDTINWLCGVSFPFLVSSPGMMLLLRAHVILGGGMPLTPQASRRRSPLLRATSVGSSVKMGWVWTARVTVRLSCPTSLVATQVYLPASSGWCRGERQHADIFMNVSLAHVVNTGWACAKNE